MVTLLAVLFIIIIIITDAAILLLVMLCGRVPAANAPGCTAAEGLLYKPWSLVFPICTANSKRRNYLAEK